MAVKKINRCLYRSDFRSFIEADAYCILGCIHDAFHELALTITVEAWLGEINILQEALLPWKDDAAEVVFGYDIPRLGKRFDVVLLLRGIIFGLEFKVVQKDALQARSRQVYLYPKCLRFKPLAVHVLPQNEDNAVHWFLEDKSDVRFSNYLEEAATEIQVQGFKVRLCSSYSRHQRVWLFH